MARKTKLPDVAHVVCGNDFPDCVFFDERRAEEYRSGMDLADAMETAKNTGKRRIYYHTRTVPVRT